MSRRPPDQQERAGTVVSFRHRAVAGAAAEGAMDAWVIGMTLSGRADLRIAAEPLRSLPGTVVVLRPRTFNAWTVPEVTGRGGTAHWDCVYSVFVPRPHWYPWLRFEEVLPGYSLLEFSSGALTGRIRRELLRVHALANGTARHGHDLALNALEKALLLAHGDCAADAAMDPRIGRAVEHLRGHLRQPIALARLAALCGMSRSHLASLFKAHVGESPSAFHERLRIEHAERRLRMSYDDIGEIAASLGFCDAKYFSKRFRRLTGKTPREIRER